MSSSVQNEASDPCCDPYPEADATGVPLGEKSVIVAIGASAGGVEALKQLFAGMPSTTGLSFVVAMHLPPDRTSILPELLSHHTAMAVTTAAEGVTLQPDTIYLLPATKELVVRSTKTFTI